MKTTTSKENTTSKTDSNKEEKVGLGELYSPEFAIEVKTIQQQQEREVPISSPSDADVGKRKLVALKDKLMEKLVAAATSFPVPEEHARPLGKAGEFLENMVKDAFTTSKDAIQNLKTHLAQIFPREERESNLQAFMLDDSEREAANPEQEEVKEAIKGHKDGDKDHKGEGEENQHGGKSTRPSVMPSASQFTPKL